VKSSIPQRRGEERLSAREKEIADRGSRCISIHKEGGEEEEDRLKILRTSRSQKMKAHETRKREKERKEPIHGEREEGEVVQRRGNLHRNKHAHSGGGSSGEKVQKTMHRDECT